jgi:hypothetical protein
LEKEKSETKDDIKKNKPSKDSKVLRNTYHGILRD